MVLRECVVMLGGRRDLIGIYFKGDWVVIRAEMVFIMYLNWAYIIVPEHLSIGHDQVIYLGMLEFVTMECWFTWIVEHLK